MNTDDEYELSKYEKDLNKGLWIMVVVAMAISIMFLFFGETNTRFLKLFILWLFLVFLMILSGYKLGRINITKVKECAIENKIGEELMHIIFWNKKQDLMLTRNYVFIKKDKEFICFKYDDIKSVKKQDIYKSSSSDFSIFDLYSYLYMVLSNGETYKFLIDSCRGSDYALDIISILLKKNDKIMVEDMDEKTKIEFLKFKK